jgi:hypothetical protein
VWEVVDMNYLDARRCGASASGSFSPVHGVSACVWNGCGGSFVCVLAGHVLCLGLLRGGVAVLAVVLSQPCPRLAGPCAPDPRSNARSNVTQVWV